MCQGLTNQEVAQQLVLSVKTVGYHLGNVYAKLDVHSRTQLAAAWTAARPNTAQRSGRPAGCRGGPQLVRVQCTAGSTSDTPQTGVIICTGQSGLGQFGVFPMWPADVVFRPPAPVAQLDRARAF